MRPTRKIIAEFVGVFLMGALVGGLIVWRCTDTQLTKFMTMTNDPVESMIARVNKKYADEYHLTPDEISRIQPTVREMSEHIYQVRHQFGLDILATLDEYHQKIADQLTPEHRAAYEAAVAERHKKLTTLLLPEQGSPSATQK